MKKVLLALVMAVLFIVGLVGYSAAVYAGNSQCVKIQSGEIIGSDGAVIYPGYNEWGYNYGARMYNGDFCDYHPVYRPGGASHDWCVENYGDVTLMMKWSDEWLSNKDCNGDGALDRGYSCDPVNANSSDCPGAWLTNHEWGSYLGDNGEMCDYYTFTKMVAAPADAYVDSGIWYTADGEEIGEVIWGAFAIIQVVTKDSCTGQHGIYYNSPAGPGFGPYK